jgi:hypothetical protein
MNSVRHRFNEMLTVVHLVILLFALYRMQGFVTLCILVPILIYKCPSYFIRIYFNITSPRGRRSVSIICFYNPIQTVLIYLWDLCYMPSPSYTPRFDNNIYVL